MKAERLSIDDPDATRAAVTGTEFGEPADERDEEAEARAAVRLGLVISGTRCLLQYVVAPAIGALGWVLGPVGLLLQLAGAVTSVAGVVRLRRLRGRWSVPYAAVAAGVVAVTAWALLHTVGLA